MRLVPISDIVIPPDRQRAEFEEGPLVELATSIHQYALINALTVRDDGVTLVAGERRLRAISTYLYPLGRTFRYAGAQVPAGMVPVIPLSELDPLALEEVELDENLKRKDLTWQEVASAQARLHSLRTKQAAARGETHTTLDTAIELGKAVGSGRTAVSLNLIVARHLDNPDIAKAKNVNDAVKILVKQEQQRKHAELGEAMGRTLTSKSHTVIRADCLEWMQGQLADPASPRYDVILTDPPYGMGADSFGDGAGRLLGIEHNYKDDYESWRELMAAWCALSYAITKPQAHAYVFCDFDRFHELKGFMEAAGWYVFRTPLINVKTNSGRVPLPDEGPRRQYEICLYAIKGHRKTTAIYSDVITSEADEQLGHGAQKPVSLYADLLKRSVAPGDLVLDTFAGSGPVIPAAHRAKCIATAVEREAPAYGMCLERLNKLNEED